MKKNYYSLQELCDLLSISCETGRNWIKTGRVQAERNEKGKPVFSQKTVKEIQRNLQNGKDTRLKSRRNKLCMQGREMYRNYLPKTSANRAAAEQILEYFRGRNITGEDMAVILADGALQLLYQAKKTQDIGDSRELVEDLWSGMPLEAYSFPRVEYVLEPGTDILGFLYLSLRSSGDKKGKGAYYTPASVVQKAVRSLEQSGSLVAGKKILDPCCGSGNFLIQFSKEVDPQDIYGRDIDEISVKLTRINLAVHYPQVSAKIWKDHIRQQNFLLEEQGEKYDCILGNPPWGYSFSPIEQESLRRRCQTAEGKRAESYDVFLEQALNRVKTDGTVAFVLPEALLYVKSHEKIREILLQQTNIDKLVYLGDVFYKVQCPSVILQLKNTGKLLETKGMQVEQEEKSFVIKKNRRVTEEGFYFHIEDKEYEILQKLQENSGMLYLKGQADFALGIVTGDNRRCIRIQPEEQAECVLRGADITKYRIQKPEQYLVFQPEKFQQTAPEKYYRSPDKLLYRFIGRDLVFARDREGLLSLNSCNIVIPKLQGVSADYILAVLNSRLARFVFQKKFRSVKVLRSHIEQLPIPPASTEQQQEVERLVKKIENADEEQWHSLYEQIDKKVASLAELTEEEYRIISPEQ